MTRRTFLALAAAAPLAAVPRTRMGIATTSTPMRRIRDTHEFLEYCHSLGAGGIQAALASTDAAYVSKLRARAEALGMYIEVMGNLAADAAAFERTLAAAREAGALAVRVACLSQRRYEQFSTLADWREFVARSKANLTRAVPLAAKHRVRLAVENHKDWTLDELLALLKEFESEYFGVCLDTGNNIALLDDPLEFTEKLAPYAFSTHIKDMGLERYEHGFRLSEMPLGEGMLEMKRIVATIAKARPDTRMTLEMITRNPLDIPCLTEKYWATFPDRSGRYLARMLALVEARHARSPLPRIDALDAAARVRLEEDNNKQCLNYAREQLGLG